MASRRPELAPGDPVVPSCGECSDSSLLGSLECLEDSAQVSGRVTAPAVAEGQGSCLRRSILSERERRRRISASCERLRTLLPHFDGRREDMASILEMAVQFLRLTHTLVADGEQHAVPAPPRETWQRWREDVLQLTLASHRPTSGPDPGTAASGVTLQRDSPSWGTLGVSRSETLLGLSELLDGPPSLPEPSVLVPWPPGWLSHSQQPTSPGMSEEAPGDLGQAASPGGLTEEAFLTPAPDARSVSGCGVEDGMPFLLTSSPDWWLGSLEGRGNTGPHWASARSSPVDMAEPAFLGDPEPVPQELQDVLLEPWSSDLGSWGLDMRDEVDSLFADFFAC